MPGNGAARRAAAALARGAARDAEADPRSHADVIVDNRDLANPVIRQGPRGQDGQDGQDG
jgi:hypothetical protein